MSEGAFASLSLPRSSLHMDSSMVWKPILTLNEGRDVIGGKEAATSSIGWKTERMQV